MRSGSVCSRFCRLGNYANMSMKSIAIFHGFKSGIYQLKKSDIFLTFLIFAQDIHCGYTLEPPH